MNAAIERKIIRWLHIIASIPIIGYIYGPVANLPRAVAAIKWVLFPLIVISGLWLWQGHRVRKWVRKTSHAYPPQTITQASDITNDELKPIN